MFEVRRSGGGLEGRLRCDELQGRGSVTRGWPRILISLRHAQSLVLQFVQRDGVVVVTLVVLDQVVDYVVIVCKVIVI